LVPISIDTNAMSGHTNNMPLTDARIRTLKAEAKPRKYADFEGLFILVNPNGSRLWRLAYRFGGKQKLLALGSYPEVSLRDARKAKEQAREQLSRGLDPAHQKKVAKARAAIAAGHTFEAVAWDWFEARRAGWVSGYSERLKARMAADLVPSLGRRPIAEIEPIELLAAIRSIEARDAPEMARRVLQMASAIFRYGVATGRCSRDPAADLRGALKASPPARRRSALSPKDLPDFMQRLSAYDGARETRFALELVIHTFVRTAEVRFAEWCEFEELDGASPLWRIPAARMKMRRDHLVPLTPRVVQVLRAVKQLSGPSALLFPAATRSGVMSENTMLFALYRMGYHGRATVHGFRSTASTILNEREFNRDWIEMQLAHSEGDIRSVYNAAEWLQGRRAMMMWWSDHLENIARLAIPESG
jgi:integrase